MERDNGYEVETRSTSTFIVIRHQIDPRPLVLGKAVFHYFGRNICISDCNGFIRYFTTRRWLRRPYVLRPTLPVYTVVVVVVEATPLFIAASRGHGNIVNYLVDKGANVSTRATLKSGDMPFDCTPVHAGFRFFQQSENEAISPEDLSTLKRNYLAIVQLLLDKGASINDRDDFGFTLMLLHAHSLKNHNYANRFLEDFFYKREDIESKNKAEAFELAAPVLLAHSQDNVLTYIASLYLKSAKKLRFSKGLSEPSDESNETSLD